MGDMTMTWTCWGGCVNKDVFFGQIDTHTHPFGRESRWQTKDESDMGRTCRVCGSSRPNEKFGGRGLRRVICSDCRRLPKAEITKILATEEVYHFLEQSNISKKNIARLESLTSIEDESFQQLRGLVLEIAKAKPHKKRRWKFLRKEHPELLERVVKSRFFDWILDEYVSNSDDEDLMYVLDQLEYETLYEQNDGFKNPPNRTNQLAMFENFGDIDPREIPF